LFSEFLDSATVLRR